MYLSQVMFFFWNLSNHFLPQKNGSHQPRILRNLRKELQLRDVQTNRVHQTTKGRHLSSVHLWRRRPVKQKLIGITYRVQRWAAMGTQKPSFLGVVSYNPYIGSLKPSLFHGLGVQGWVLVVIRGVMHNRPVFKIAENIKMVVTCFF